MKKIGKKDILIKFLNEQFKEGIEDDEFTTEELVKQSVAEGKKISAAKVRHKMVKLVEEGKVTSRKALVNGRSVNVYRMV